MAAAPAGVAVPVPVSVVGPVVVVVVGEACEVWEGCVLSAGADKETRRGGVLG